MVRFVRTASVAPGKLGDALAFAKAIAEYIAKRHGVTLEVLMPVGGNPQRIAWKTDYASLAALEEVTTKLLADATYLEMSAKGSGNFIAGSLNDAIWRTV
jgi:hypothetical protein